MSYRNDPPARQPHPERLVVLVIVFALLALGQIWGITHQFSLLPSHIRDWSIALGSLTTLPLGGSPADDGSHTIGPAFYWMLWLIRTVIGPWFDNLPHAAAISEAVLQSVADTLLLTAVWRRSGSLWIALGTIVVTALAWSDLSGSAVGWNSTAAFALAEIATALVLLETPGQSEVGAAVTAAVAWCAVQCSTEAIFASTAVIVALFAVPLFADDRALLRRNLWTVAMVVAVLQIPHAVHKTLVPTNNEASSASGLLPALAGQAVFCVWVLLAVTPLAAKSVVRVAAIALLVTALTLVPHSLRMSPNWRPTAEYTIVVDGSRKMARRSQPLRAIRVDFPVPSAHSAEFLYTILGGHLDPTSPWVGAITNNGEVAYERVSPAQ